MLGDTFHPFPRLPTELREEIWRLCLPHRVSELDYPYNWLIGGPEAYREKFPCSLRSTSDSNGRPPLLTRVCVESRRVAYRSGNWVSVLETQSPKPPDDAWWEVANSIDGDYWQDPLRDSIHLHWTKEYEVEIWYPDVGHPLTSLAWESKRLNGSASFMLHYMTSFLMEREPYDRPVSHLLEDIPVFDFRQEDFVALRLLPQWSVVVKVVIVHLDLARATKTGLFGLSGDAPVQVLDAASPLASQLYELAEACEREAVSVTAAQDFTRMSANDMDAMVQRVAFKNLHNRELSMRMRAAIMFRLCTKMCNHSNTLEEGITGSAVSNQ